MKVYLTATNTSIYDSCYRIMIIHNDPKSLTETIIVDKVLYDANIMSTYKHLLSGNAFNMALAQWYERNPKLCKYLHQQKAFEKDHIQFT